MVVCQMVILTEAKTEYEPTHELENSTPWAISMFSKDAKTWPSLHIQQRLSQACTFSKDLAKTVSIHSLARANTACTYKI